MASCHWREIQSGRDNVIRKSKEPMRIRHVARERTSHLTNLDPTGLGGKMERKREKEKKEGES